MQSAPTSNTGTILQNREDYVIADLVHGGSFSDFMPETIGKDCSDARAAS